MLRLRSLASCWVCAMSVCVHVGQSLPLFGGSGPVLARSLSHTSTFATILMFILWVVGGGTVGCTFCCCASRL